MSAAELPRRRLGRDGPEISVIGYGAWEAGGDMWGSPVADDEVVETMRAAIDAGMNWIDTAEAYGDGRSEELVARALQGRDDVFVFTKVAPFATGTRPEEVKKAIRGSLQRLAREHVDLYQVHWPDEDRVPVEETWGAMAEVAEEGLARWIGVSNFDRGLVERCEAIRHVDSVQNQFSLLHLDDRDELLPWLDEQGIGYLGYGPLAFGLLTGTIDRDTTFDESDWRGGGEWDLEYYRDLFAPGALERSLEKVEALKAALEGSDVSLPSAALAAALRFRGVTALIAGTRNAKHVRANAEAGTLDLDDSLMQTIAEVFGP